jgi:hypothetical protein
VVPCVKEESRLSEISGFEQDGQFGVSVRFQPWHAGGDFLADMGCGDAEPADDSAGGFSAGDDKLSAAYADESFGDRGKAIFG